MNLQTLARSVLIAGVFILTAVNPAKAGMKNIGRNDQDSAIWVSDKVFILDRYQDVRVGTMSIGGADPEWIAVDCVKGIYSGRVTSHRNRTWTISENPSDWVDVAPGTVGALVLHEFCSYIPD